MDPISETVSASNVADAALSGGELLFIFIAITVVAVACMVGGFMLLNGSGGRSRASRTSRQREEERMRNHRDLVERIRSYSRRCEEAVTTGEESADEALKALVYYGEGVIDTIACNTRNVKQIDSIRRQVGEEVERLQTVLRPAAQA